ncbi:Facilitated trehalose transporter Tret1 [Anthophora quadrimaculata]
MTVEGGTNIMKPSKRSQIIASLIVNLPLLSCGLSFSWITVSNLDLNTDKGSWIVTALSIGACLGPILSALLLDRIGRKWFLYATTFPFIASWILIYIGKKWVEFFVARFIAGISIGAIYTMVPVYLGELTEPRIRGAAGTLMALFLNIGYILMFGLGTRLNEKMMALISLAPCVAFLLMAPWVPESPYYYLKKKKEKFAILALVWLRRKKDNEDEIKEMNEFIKAEEQGSIKELYTVPTHRKALLLVLLLLAGQQLSGYIAIQAYAITLLQDMHVNISTNLVLLIMGGIALVMSLVPALIVDRIGRKPLFLMSSYSTTLCLLTIGVYFLMIKIGMKIQSYSIIPLVAVLAYLVCASIGLTVIPAVIISEIFPIGLKSWATMFANVYGSLLGLIVAQVYHLISQAWGNHVLFLLFAIIELVISILATIFMPETARKSFMDIQKILGKDNNVAQKADAEKCDK